MAASQDGAVIQEVAMLPVIGGQEAEFEAAFAQARPIIAASPGCEGVRLLRCHERPSTYLLLVQWRTLEDHTVGFRGSPAYEQWKALLHHFYQPFPVVEHFSDVF